MRKRWKRTLKEMKNLIKEQKIKMNIEIEFNPHIEINPIIIGCIAVNKNPEISTIPTVKRYFYIPNSDIHLRDSTVIPANLFINDYGNRITEFMVYEPNGYINLYLNGVMQEGNLYILSSSSLTFNPVSQTISAGTPIIVESVGFSTK